MHDAQARAVIKYSKSSAASGRYSILIYNGYDLVVDPKWVLKLVDYHKFIDLSASEVPSKCYFVVDVNGKPKKLEVITHSTSGVVDALDIIVSDEIGDMPPASGKAEDDNAIPQTLYEIDPQQPALLEFNQWGHLTKWNIPAAFPGRFPESAFRKGCDIERFIHSATLSPFRHNFDIKKTIKFVIDNNKTFFYHSHGIDLAGNEVIYLITLKPSKSRPNDAVALIINNAHKHI